MCFTPFWDIPNLSSPLVTIDLPAGVIVHHGACSSIRERLRPGVIQASSSRAGLQDDARWHSTTPSNYFYYYYYHYHYHYHHHHHHYYYYYYQ